MDMEPFELINQWLWFVVNLAKVIAWPVAVVVATWWLRPLIAPLMRSLALRKVDVDAFGFKAKMDAVEQQQQEAHTSLPTVEVQTDLPPARPVVLSVEQKIRNHLSASQVDAQKQIVYLVRALAEMHLRAGAEFTYNRIFGSQIGALKWLDHQGGAPVADVVGYFNQYAQQYPDVYKSYNFDGWLAFLTGNGLLEQAGDRLRTTELGHEFLVYMAETRLSEAKPY
jgi:hypothetical protein